MVPLIKRSTDTLIERFEEEIATKKSFNIHRWIILPSLKEKETECMIFFLFCRVFGCFTMETILAIAFGHQQLRVYSGMQKRVLYPQQDLFWVIFHFWSDYFAGKYLMILIWWSLRYFCMRRHSILLKLAEKNRNPRVVKWVKLNSATCNL